MIGAKSSHDVCWMRVYTRVVPEVGKDRKRERMKK